MHLECMHVNITLRASTTKEIDNAGRGKMANMGPPEAMELSQRYLKDKEEGPRHRNESGSNRQRARIHLAWDITLADSYVIGDASLGV